MSHEWISKVPNDIEIMQTVQKVNDLIQNSQPQEIDIEGFRGVQASHIAMDEDAQVHIGLGSSGLDVGALLWTTDPKGLSSGNYNVIRMKPFSESHIQMQTVTIDEGTKTMNLDQIGSSIDFLASLIN